jgi:uncharacterized protein YjbI with pentapeptide repeats
MAIATPAFAIVRPRVRLKRTGESHLIDDVISELAEDLSTGVIWITGGPGSGKSTAISHLAALFSHVEHLIFLDEPSPTELEQHQHESLVVATMTRPSMAGIEFALQPWGQDELIEYLLALHHDDCGSVIARLGKAASRDWCPELASIVLDRFADDYELVDASDALLIHVDQLLTDAKQRHASMQYCVALFSMQPQSIEGAREKLAKTGCTSSVWQLLRHEMVQLPLAASRIFSLLLKGYFVDLETPLPYELVELIGWQCAANADAMKQLRKGLAVQRAAAAHAMIASVLHVADPAWRPERPTKPWRFVGAIFQDAQWPGVDFSRADLARCDLTHSNLEGGVFEAATLTDADLSGANLREARFGRAQASGAQFHEARLERAKLVNVALQYAVFSQANLSEAALMLSDLTGVNLAEAILRKADLSQANLGGAIVENADFTEANLRKSILHRVDLRTAFLNGTCLEETNLSHAQLEDVQILHARLYNADLQSAHLTGSSLPSADLRRANLFGAGLADIDWEEADLRDAVLVNATFHMGSSRSGLVGSPYACEGSKTGFYTDDLEDLSFKRPEEVRKANLRGADLRGVNADGVDFFLVDLRDAKLDAPLRQQAQKTGAIMDDFGN